MTGLETILEQHLWDRGYGCCGIANRDLWPAHVADQIRGWLLSDPVITEAAESIADAHWCESNYTSGCNCRDYREQEARAAITAALDQGDHQ